MKNNEKLEAFIMQSKCNYSHMVVGTYNMVLSCHFQREYCKNLSYPITIKGNLREKGSKFIIKRPDLNMYIFHEIIDIIITDYYACFKYHVYKTIPETYEYDYILALRYLNEGECDFFICFIFDQNIYLTEKEILEEIKFKKNLYKNIERSLTKFEILKISTAYTTINSKIEIIIDILKNMKVIHKYAHLLSDEIDYKGNILKKHSLINIIDKSDKKVFKTKAKVHKFDLNKSELSKEFIMELIFEKDMKTLNDNSKKKIMIIIYEYKGCCSMYILYFFAKIQKNKENFINFRKIKNKELTNFKNIIENYNNNINKSS